MMKMKNIGIILALFVFVFQGVNAQEAPKTVEADLEGMKLIARESVKGTVSARLFLKGGVSNYHEKYSGIEELMFSMIAEGGPADMSKQEYQQSLEKIGARIGSSSGYDYSNISLSCIRQYWEEAFTLYSRAINNPAFRQEDFDLIKNKLITAAKQERTNPDAHLNNLSMANAWEGTDYAKKPSGTLESLEKLITLDILKEHYERLMVRDKVFMVVVGDIDSDELTKTITELWKDFPKGKGESKWVVEENTLKEGLIVEDRKIETNYIKGVFSAPAKGTEASIHNALAMRIMGKRFFEELRTKRSLSYAPAAGTTGYIARPMNQIYISTTDPEQSLGLMVELINDAKTKGFEKDELEGTKQSFLTGYYMGQETNASISMSLGVNEIFGGWEKMDLFTERVLNTKLKDINAVFAEYGDKIHWTYLGKEEMVNPDFFKQPVQSKKIKK